MATLFGVKVPAINKHLKNVFDSKELDEDSVVSILETTAADNKKYKTRFYNLDAIVSVGYRVNSYQATQFRSKYFCKMRGPDPETLPRWEMAAQVASQVVAHACAKAAWASWQVAAGFKCWSMGKRGLVGIKEAVAGNTDRE
ncbi:MAG: virulence RhuM family protein [Deltaproteobacteria bacterium]|nr:virulence RhuM family protein [Deltaproteobacteria bacterium]